MREYLCLLPLVWVLASCTVTSESPPSAAGGVTDADIVAFLNATVKERALAYPDARLVNLEMNPSRSMACGFIIRAGKPAHVMISRDVAPPDTDRPVTMPALAKEGMWDLPANARTSARHLQSCREQGLLRDGPPLDN